MERNMATLINSNEKKCRVCKQRCYI